MGYQDQLAQWSAENNASSGWGSALGALGGIAAAWKSFEDGGLATNDPISAVPVDATQGGRVPMEASPSGGRAVDDVPAALNAGEFVVPKDVVSWKGEEFFQKEIQKARQAKSTAPARPSPGAPGISPAVARGVTRSAIPV
jgi:hypothetical protein